MAKISRQLSRVYSADSESSCRILRSGVWLKIFSNYIANATMIMVEILFGNIAVIPLPETLYMALNGTQLTSHYLVHFPPV